MVTISCSVVAMLLPRSTMVLPRFSYAAGSRPVMLANRASMVAASSDARFVVTPSIAMTRVKSAMFSVSIPSWPAASPIPASSFTSIGISVSAMFLNVASSAINSASVASTVFCTPVKDDSHCANSRTASPVIAVMAPPAAVNPAATAVAPARNLSKRCCMASAASAPSWRHPSSTVRRSIIGMTALLPCLRPLYYLCCAFHLQTRLPGRQPLQPASRKQRILWSALHAHAQWRRYGQAFSPLRVP